MRACAFALILLAAPALADAKPKIVVAPAGECAGEERELAAGPFPKPPEAAEVPGLSLLHLTPANVAASAPSAGAALPTPPAFTGPGPCDNPGSGCSLAEIVDDPNPEAGCGFPGSTCP